MAEKRYYWLKLKVDFFDEKYVKALRKLPQGDSLVIVYLKMQLKSIKTEGYIYYEGLFPDSITELAIYLDEDENLVRLAVEALISFRVIERLDNETLYMVALQNLIGSETKAAERMRNHRERNNVTNQRNNVTTEIDIDIEIDKDLELERENITKTSSRFHPPTLEEITKYAEERKSSVNPERFYDYYKARGWKTNNGLYLKDWKAAYRSWEKNGYNDKPPSNPANDNSSFSVETAEQTAFERYRKSS